MATYTDNYNLKKPAPEDFADIADLNENADKIDAALKDKADLDESGKLKESQLPNLSYIPASQKGTAGGVASLGSDGKVPSGQLPAMDYIPTSQKGTAGGVASLGSDGKVPSGQLPSLDYIPTSQKAAANGVASLDANKKVPVAQIPALGYIPTSQKGTAGGVATLGSDGKIPDSQLGTVGVPPQIIATIPSGSSVTCKCGSKTLTATSTGTVTFNLTGYTERKIPLENIVRRKVGRQRSPASHLTLKAFTLHAVGAGRLRREESRSQFVKLFPKAEHNVAGFGGITPASSLAYHVLPLIRRRADNQNVSQALRGQIAGRVIVHAVLDEELILPHSVLTLGEVGETHLTIKQLIRDNEVGLIRVVAVLQRRGHELDLVLVSRNLGEESP